MNGYGVYRTVNGSVGNVAGLYSLPLEYQRQVVDAFGAGLPRCIECCSAAARDGVAKVRGAQAEAEREAAELDAWYAAGEPERRRRFPEVVGQLAKHLSSLGYPTTEGVRVHKAPAYRRKGLFSTRVPFGDAWQVVGPIGPGWFYEVRSSGTSSDHGLAYRLQSVFIARSGQVWSASARSYTEQDRVFLDDERLRPLPAGSTPCFQQIEFDEDLLSQFHAWLPRT